MAIAASELTHVEGMIAPSMEAMGFQLVQLRWIGESGMRTLQIMAERCDHEDMVVEDCAELSRTISAILDVEDPLPGAYMLDVGSPGLDRPLVRLEDFDRFAGREARLEMSELIAGQKRFRGILAGLRENNIRLSITSKEGSEQTVELPFEQIEKAKLILTEALIQESLKKQRKQAK
jgi:ribosome maturation factor RimP